MLRRLAGTAPGSLYDLIDEYTGSSGQAAAAFSLLLFRFVMHRSNGDKFVHAVAKS
jgi:hypothetical protein